jgi:hypothetical protein
MVAVQEFRLGLDFSNNVFGAHLAEGSYLAVQIPEATEVSWDWADWVFDPAAGQVVNRSTPGLLIDKNYLVFSIRRHAS